MWFSGPDAVSQTRKVQGEGSGATGTGKASDGQELGRIRSQPHHSHTGHRTDPHTSRGAGTEGMGVHCPDEFWPECGISTHPGGPSFHYQSHVTCLSPISPDLNADSFPVLHRPPR